MDYRPKKCLLNNEASALESTYIAVGNTFPCEAEFACFCTGGFLIVKVICSIYWSCTDC